MLRILQVLPYLVVVAGNLLVHLPLFAGQILFSRDRGYWTLPSHSLLRRSFLEGDFANWNPFQGLGISTWSNPQYGIAYPLNWLLPLVPEGSLSQYMTWHSLVHVGIGTAGMIALCRALGTSRVAACVAGAAWGLSGHICSLWTVGLQLPSGAWLPWIAGAAVRLARADTVEMKLRQVGGLALFASISILAGDIFSASMGLLFGLIVSVAAGPIDPDGKDREPGKTTRWLIKHLAWLAAAGFVTGIIAAIVMLPAAAALDATSRAGGLTRDLAEHHSFHPVRILEMLASGSMGNPYGAYPAASVVADPRINNLPLAFSSYLGVTVMGLALLGLTRRRLPIVVGGAFVFFLIVAMGYHTPVHAAFRQLVPIFRFMRYPEKYLAICAAAAAILAALGTDRLLGETVVGTWKQIAGRFGGFLAVLFVLTLVLLLAPRLFAAPWAIEVRGAITRSLLLGVMLPALAITLRHRRSALSVLVLLLVVIDLGSAALRLFPYLTPEVATRLPPAAHIIRERSRGRVDVARLYRSPLIAGAINRSLRGDSVLETEVRQLQTLAPNSNIAAGIASLPGYDAAIPQVLADLWTMQHATGTRVLRLLSADFALLPTTGSVMPAGLDPIAEILPGAYLFQVTSPLPRVYVVGRVAHADTETILPRLMSDDVIEGRLAFVARDAGMEDLEPGADNRPGDCVLKDMTNTSLDAACTLSAPGLVVFVHQFAPGWSATIDGRPADIVRANLFMRGVKLRAGTHRVRLRYHPPYVMAGSLVSMSGVMLSILLLTGPWLRRRNWWTRARLATPDSV